MPRWPNDRAARDAVEGYHLNKVMIAFLNWRSRHVPARPRSVQIERAVLSDPRWISHSQAVHRIAEKARKGEDLTPHLSLLPQKIGVAPLARGPGSTSEQRWADKDFLLTTTGFHHFHLGVRLEPKGHAERTDDLLVAEVTRDRFVAVSLTTHGVFDMGSDERRRINRICEAHSASMIEPGTAYMRPPIMSSGHTMQVVFYADACLRQMTALDVQLDDRDFQRRLYADADMNPPAKPKLRWHFLGLDFGLMDAASNVFFSIHRGWM